jgi:hypothetical protein
MSLKSLPPGYPGKFFIALLSADQTSEPVGQKH